MTKLLLQIALQLVFTSSVLAASTDTSALGQAFFLAKKDILGDFDLGSTIFESLPKSCLKVVEKPYTKKVSTFYKTSDSFYNYVSSKVGISTSIQGGFTMGTTLTTASKSISGSSLETSGMSLDIYALKDATVLSQDCQNEQPLSKKFLGDFQKLPVQIDDPNDKSAWIHYDSFLKKYGSHLVKEINHGARLQHWTFAKQTEEYTERDFSVRSCVDLTFPGVTTMVSEVCGNYSTQEKETVKKYTMSKYLVLKGGRAETRAQLVKGRTAKLIQKFLLEAQTHPGNVLYKWTAVWDLLKERYFGVSDDNLARTMNLEAYYKGVLDFGCTRVSRNGLALRWLQQTGTPNRPMFSCQIAPEGCREDSDCHLKGAGSVCYCYGETCVDTESVNNPKNKIKEERVIRTGQEGSYDDGINNSCFYKFIAHCNCNSHWGGDPTTVWPSASEVEFDVQLWQLHARMVFAQPLARMVKQPECSKGSGYRLKMHYTQVLLCLMMFLVIR